MSKPVKFIVLRPTTKSGKYIVAELVTGTDHAYTPVTESKSEFIAKRMRDALLHAEYHTHTEA